MSVILNYDNLCDTMVSLLEEARDKVFLTSFNLDVSYDDKLHDAIMKALKRKILRIFKIF